ncbi:hypothetical protein HMSSN139_43580 [Paenibacillus sp. HMSSN-139]|nr:hypothetical protein HMSSN139_43580 [Paenibacillus sp. HMSSN-139]
MEKAKTASVVLEEVHDFADYDLAFANSGVGEVTIVVNIVVSVVVMILLQLLGMVVFNWMTPYRDMEELKKGNVAVALALGGKFLGTAIILGVSAFTNTSILHIDPVVCRWLCVPRGVLLDL